MPVNFLDLFIVSIGEKICLKLLQVIIIQSENPDSLCHGTQYCIIVAPIEGARPIPFKFRQFHDHVAYCIHLQVNLCQKFLLDCSLFMKSVGVFVLTFRTILVHNLFCRCCELLKKIYLYYGCFCAYGQHSSVVSICSRPSTHS